MLKFTPRDIQKQEFKKILRGYDPVEVDTFLEMVADEYELLLRIKKELEEKVIKYETELKNYKVVEVTLQETLVEAKRTSTELIESSKKEAAVIVREAEVRAKAMIEEAEYTVKKLQDGLESLRAQKESMVRQLKQLLQSQLEYLKSVEKAGQKSGEGLGIPQKPEKQKEVIFTGVEPGTNDKDDLQKGVSMRPISQPVRSIPLQSPAPQVGGAQQTAGEKKLPGESSVGTQRQQPLQQKPTGIPKIQPTPEDKLTPSGPKTMIRNGFDLIDKILDEEEQKPEEE
jgi:cell division initiation protein